MSPAQLTRKLVKNGVFRFTASIDAVGVPVHVEILAGIRFARPTFAVGFSFDRESYGALAKKLSGVGVDFLDKLGLEFEVKQICYFLIPFESSIIGEIFIKGGADVTGGIKNRRKIGFT